MTQILGFKGSPASGLMKVHVVTVDGERELVPAEGVKFEWGHMGSTTGHLARAIAAELFGEASTPQAAEHIKRHFLTMFPRQHPFALDAGEAVAYVEMRMAGRSPPLAGAA